ncbi:MAG: HAD family hydrolase [Candidatus Saelkia tenebricola]|nr:HAD family hydrolase [Candidatus Saelkia tenebricola]
MIIKIGGKKLSKVKLVIFDLDGTLVNAYRAIEVSLNYTRARFNLPNVGYRTIKASVGGGDKNFIAFFFPLNLVEKALAVYRKKHARELINSVKLLPHSVSILSYLKRNNYLIAIASNRPTFFTELILRHLKLNRFIDYVLCADKINKLKPDPQILFDVMKKLKCSPGESIYVGDMAIDVETAKNAKIKAIAVRTGSSSAQELENKKPFFILDNLKLLRDLL